MLLFHLGDNALRGQNALRFAAHFFKDRRVHDIEDVCIIVSFE